MKNSFWVWNYLTWLWLSIISRLMRDIYLNWVAAEVLKVGAGNFGVIFTTQLIACPFKAESLHTISHLLNTITANSVPLNVLHIWAGPWGSFPWAVMVILYLFSRLKATPHIHISTLFLEILFLKHQYPIVWCLGFWLYKLLATNFPS